MEPKNRRRRAAKRANQGRFTPSAPQKYVGNVKNIIYRSGLELRFFSYVDKHPDVLQWSSEETIIPYLHPLDGCLHRYFPDLWMRRRNKDGLIEELLIEIKPARECVQPVKPEAGVTKRFLQEMTTYAINKSKWIHAEQYCKHKGWKFVIITDKEIKGLGD